MNAGRPVTAVGMAGVVLCWGAWPVLIAAGLVFAGLFLTARGVRL